MKLRWFTPAAEVKLCGHGTLAATHISYQSGQVKQGESIYFNILSGTLTANIVDTSAQIANLFYLAKK